MADTSGRRAVSPFVSGESRWLCVLGAERTSLAGVLDEPTPPLLSAVSTGNRLPARQGPVPVPVGQRPVPRLPPKLTASAPTAPARGGAAARRCPAAAPSPRPRPGRARGASAGARAARPPPPPPGRPPPPPPPPPPPRPPPRRTPPPRRASTYPDRGAFASHLGF